MILPGNRNRKKIIETPIDLINYREALAQIVTFGKSKTSGYVCFANVHMTIEAYEDKIFADQLNKASLVLPDGMPLVKSLKLFYGLEQDRVAGMDIMPDLIKIANQEQLKILFFGTTPEILEKIKSRIEQESPNVNIVGLISPPFDKSLDDQSYIDIINHSQANLVFVALGCPKQEKWMANHSYKINSILLGVGGALPVYAGITNRAPLFMRNMGLEWLYRLFQEPNRLFMRYFKTNSLFIYLILKIKFKDMFNK